MSQDTRLNSFRIIVRQDLYALLSRGVNKLLIHGSTLIIVTKLLGIIQCSRYSCIIDLTASCMATNKGSSWSPVTDPLACALCACNSRTRNNSCHSFRYFLSHYLKAQHINGNIPLEEPNNCRICPIRNANTQSPFFPLQSMLPLVAFSSYITLV